MDIRLTDYLKQGRRIACSECVLCLTCTSVCPQQLLWVTIGADFGTEDYVRRRSDRRVGTEHLASWTFPEIPKTPKIGEEGD